MTGTEAPAAPAAPVLLLRGRFAVTEMGDGSWVIRWAGPLCDTCQGCGCGDQQPPITVPAMLVGLMKAHSEGRRIGVGQLRKLAAMAMGGLTGNREPEHDSVSELEAGADD